MTEKAVKILKNVFFSTNENRLKLVDIQFSAQIEKIIERTSKEIDWQEISSVEIIYFAPYNTGFNTDASTRMFFG